MLSEVGFEPTPSIVDQNYFIAYVNSGVSLSP